MSEAQAPYSVRSGEATITRTPAPMPVAAPVAQAYRPPGLRGVPIPSRSRAVRKLVMRLYEFCPHLAAPDIFAATRLCHLYRKIEKMGRDLEERGLFKLDGDPRKAIGEWRSLLAEARAHEAALGITAVSRAGLGVDVGRMRQLAKGGDDASEGDVAALEARLLERLDPGRQSRQDEQGQASDGP